MVLILTQEKKSGPNICDGPHRLLVTQQEQFVLKRVTPCAAEAS
jgi:hypothetical protein